MIEWLSFDAVAHLWQSTLVIGVVWLMTLALRGNRAHVRHRLWLAASVKFLVPFSWFVSLGAQLEWRTAPSIAQPAATFVMEEILAPPVIAAVASVPAAHTTSAWPWVLASIWVVGVAGVLFWWWRQWRLVQAAVDQAKPSALGSAYDVAGLTVMSSPWTFEPGVVGIWRPVLLLPEGLADRLTPAQLNTVIAHERCHIGRRDNLAAAVHMVVEAIFWFHPLVWWIERRMLDERERACDEAVLGAGNDPDEYVAGILSVCRFTLRAPLACVAGVSGAELRTRIESIVRMELGKRMTVTRRVAVALVAAVLLGVPIVVGLVKTPVPVMAAEQQFLPPPPGTGVDRNTRFEVASVRPVDDATGQIFMRMTPASGLEATMPVGMLLRVALQKPDYQIVGAPGWVDTERYSIRARASGGTPAAAVMVMLGNLLKDRFQLATHPETRELPIFHLVMARSDGRFGPDFKPTSAECQATTAERQAAARRGDPPPPLSPSLFDPKARPCGLSRVDSGVAVGTGQTVAQISSTLSDLIGRTVIDKTGLTGLYDFTLKYAPEPGRYAGPTGPPPGAPTPAIDPNVSSLSVAVQEQLGLKFEGARGPVEVLVIDRIERPTPD